MLSAGGYSYAVGSGYEINNLVPEGPVNIIHRGRGKGDERMFGEDHVVFKGNGGGRSVVIHTV